ncbi:MAG: hypothetical protein H7Z16_13955 [Pyrinomonadaceae bacterium]|nr:hypothetical protein [Pyrinomonadaceae bacterium]
MTDPRPYSGVRSALKWQHWVLRLIVLYASAYTIIGILHEWAHALTAYALGVPSTLFHLYAQINRGVGTLNERAVIRAAGPLFCLGVGLVCWFAYRKAKGSRAELLLLYLAWFGIATFFGNLTSTPFVGDFSSLALAFELSMPVRYGAGVFGLLLLCGLSFLMGMELRKWVPANVGRARAMIGVVAIPVIVGTALCLLIYLPMPLDFASARAGESAFWIFGAVGALISRKQPAESRRHSGLGWTDFAILLAAAGVLRLMVAGIVFEP